LFNLYLTNTLFKKKARKKMKTTRIYSNPQDLQAMIALLNSTRTREQLDDYPSATNLHELLQSDTVKSNTRLWFEGEKLFAFTLVDEYNNILFDCLAEQLDAIGDEIIAWGLSRLPDDAETLDTNSRADNVTRLAFLEKHGFVKTSMESIAMRRDLSQPIPEPVLPVGFSIRALKGEEEAEKAAELHRLAFDSDQVTTEVRLTWMRVPSYDPSLDLLAVAPDGTFAAYCMCSIDTEQNEKTGRLEGYTDPVATHPDYQKLGLARALMLTGMRMLKERGMDAAALGTSSENSAMQKSAQAVGFYVVHKKLWFEKRKP
jgi:ribosomal protein S18 acetylase RimI-like enzyme